MAISLKTFLPHSDESIRLYACDRHNVRKKYLSSFPCGFGFLLGTNLKDEVPQKCSDAFITFKKSLFHLLFLPSTLTTATDEVKLMDRDTTLIGDQELSLALFTRWAH